MTWVSHAVLHAVLKTSRVEGEVWMMSRRKMAEELMCNGDGWLVTVDVVM